MIAAGRRSKWCVTRLAIFSSSIFPVLNVSTRTLTGRATPIAYATCTSHRSANPAVTTFFATQRAAYEAERSTFVGSLPEKAPPPWRAMPPYVSTMILRPVRPADDEPTGGVDMSDRILDAQVGRDYGHDHRFEDLRAELLDPNVRVVLGRDDDIGDAL